ncbi:MAG: hypothetical protein L0241_31970 [Planctomycetia bacterium]|nr:hypothetical protein [Planctomycetia bacterium]
MQLITWFTMALVLAVTPLLPSPYDKDGVGLRVHNLSDRGPYFVGENIDVRYNITLVNHSKATLVHDPFVVAMNTRQLVYDIINPDGKRIVPPLPSPHHGFSRDPFTAELKLRPGEFATEDFRLRDWWSLTKAGRYQIVATWTIDGRKLTSPPMEFDVVDIPPEAVLASIPVALDSEPKNPSKRPCVQQVKVGKKVLLIYRGAPATRLAELPGKVEMSVEGVYGFGNPITIKYADTNSKTGTTTLVIHSIGGTPWTAEMERLRREREEEEKARIAPPPRPVKP